MFFYCSVPPQPIQLPSEVSKEFPLYSLYVYAEGELVQDLEDKIYAGVPVLFIPGNGGSHKQGEGEGRVRVCV